jgi:hypothetical protein
MMLNFAVSGPSRKAEGLRTSVTFLRSILWIGLSIHLLAVVSNIVSKYKKE